MLSESTDDGLIPWEMEKNAFLTVITLSSLQQVPPSEETESARHTGRGKFLLEISVEIL